MAWISSKRTGLAILGCASGLIAGQAVAGDWIVTIGVRPQAAAPYEGADHDTVLPVPSFAMRRAGQPERLAAPDDSYGAALLSWRWISAGPALRLRGSRDDLGKRAGLRRIDTAFEPGLFVNLWPTDWLRIHGEERKGVAGHHGWVGDAAFDLVAQKGPWTGSIGPRLGWGDRRYMNTYFGVTPAEAAANTLVGAAYAPDGGMRYVGATGTLAYRFDAHWQANANAGVHRLADAGGDSPIVRTVGDRTEAYGGIGVKYTFEWTR